MIIPQTSLRELHMGRSDGSSSSWMSNQDWQNVSLIRFYLLLSRADTKRPLFCFKHEAFWSPKSCKCNYFKELVILGRVGTDSTHRGAEKREDVRERDGQSRPGLLLPFGTSGCWPTSGMVATILSDGEKKSERAKVVWVLKKNYYQAMFKFQV